MSQSKDHAALGLSLGEAGVEAGAASKITASASTAKPTPTATATATGTNAAPPQSPISIRGRQELHSGAGHETGAGVLAHPAIPPPPSPRVHRARTRGSSGGMTSSKSVGDLMHLGLAMTSPAQPSIDTIQAPQPQSSATEQPQLADEPTAYDNSARFYYRMHNSSRSTSPTRTPSVSPSVRSSSARSTSPGVSPAQSKRNLTLAPGSTASSSSHAPGASLSASLSPNSHFLQQHLPPTFPIPHVSPDGDVPDPLSQSWSGSHLQPAQVILTPTTQEWRELKGIGELENDGPIGTDGSDSDDADSKAVWSSAKSEASSGLDYFSIKGGSSGIPTPLQAPLFQPVITAPSPLTEKRAEVPDNGAAVQPTSSAPTEQEAPSLGFTSIGRRDSLRQKERKGKGTPKPKTKRELERERLFKMVDEEIAESGGEGSEAEASDKASRRVSVGSPSMSPTSPESAASLSSPEAIVPAPEAPRALNASDLTSAPNVPRPPFPMLSKSSSLSVPPRPSPLHRDSSRVSTPSSDGSSNIVNLGSEGDLTNVTATANETERYEAIRDYARQMSTRKALDSGPSRPGSGPGSRAHSRRGSYDGAHSPPRSPRRRDTLRVSLVAGRVIRPADYPDLKPFTPAAPGTVLSPKTTLQSFSPFRRGSPVGNQRPGLAPAAVSYASTIAAPSEPSTPDEETSPGGIGGHGIDDYVIVKEAGKGAYGLVMRARVKGATGEPIGDEVIIKYVIKSRILADCWKKHKVLGPIPVEIHVMDQLRHLIYLPPAKPHPWDPFRPKTLASDAVSNGEGQASNGNAPSDAESVNGGSRASTPASQSNVTSRYISGELKHAPERGHPNVCKLLDFFEDREFYYLVMPRYGNGEDLFDYVEAHADGLSAFEVRSFVGQLTDAVRFLHTNGIVHRDIKDENVILDGQGRCQLIDFGSAAHWRPGKRWDTFSGTLHYASPEILRGEMYGGKEQDVWALGTVAYVLIVGETPFSDLPDEVFVGLVPGSRAVNALMARCGGEHADEGREADGGGALGDAVDFVMQCLQPAVADRPTAETLLLHRYLAGGDGWTGFRGWQRK